MSLGIAEVTTRCGKDEAAFDRKTLNPDADETGCGRFDCCMPSALVFEAVTTVESPLAVDCNFSLLL